MGICKKFKAEFFFILYAYTFWHSSTEFNWNYNEVQLIQIKINCNSGYNASMDYAFCRNASLELSSEHPLEIPDSSTFWKRWENLELILENFQYYILWGP